MRENKLVYKCLGCKTELKTYSSRDGMNCPICKSREFILIGPDLNNERPYFQVTLEKIHSVPEVFYKGEKVHFKREVLLHWETDTDEFGGTTIEIEHVVNESPYPKTNRIEEKIKGHSFD
ncbi:hypothetical protein [Gracilibacillus dipsosauri]|uniref:hypothetical protein n=1 Tax=Gracilibacillus dipsosauri TaxID=178340 RepID=UPI0024092530